jgi:hypothetical protein
VRSDLSVGLQFAQLVHAAGESGPAEPHTYAVALAARDEEHLLQIADKLEAAGIPHVVIHESDGPHGGQATAIGCRPGPKSVVGRPLGSLPLLGRKQVLVQQLEVPDEAQRVLQEIRAEMLERQTDMPADYAEVVDKHFWELV